MIKFIVRRAGSGGCGRWGSHPPLRLLAMAPRVEEAVVEGAAAAFRTLVACVPSPCLCGSCVCVCFIRVCLYFIYMTSISRTSARGASSSVRDG